MTLWLKFIPTGSFHIPLVIDADKSPCPAVMAGGMNTLSPDQHYLEDDGRMDLFTIDPSKPPYRVPSMDEVRAVPWNGLTVASTFSGCGGSSTGYRMAGYRVLWANEFVPAAQDSYAANMAPYTVLDRRDIRQVLAVEILDAIKMKPGELDLFDGSPPCQAFSTAGQRERGWGKDRDYGHGAEPQKNEDMFYEFVRLLEGLKPKAFIAENVSGLVKGTAKGYFIEILRRLKACGYRVEARLLDAQWLGVPQSRQRIIFVGVREDVGLAPAFPAPLPYRYSVREACPWLGGARMTTEGHGKLLPGAKSMEEPARAVRNGHGGGARDMMVEGEGKLVMRRGYGEGAASESARSFDDPSFTIPADNNASGMRVVHDTGRPGQSAKDVTDRPSPAITAGPNDPAEGGGQRNHFKVERVLHRKEFTHEMLDVTDQPAPTVTVGGKVTNAGHFQVVCNSSNPSNSRGKSRDGDKVSPGVLAHRPNLETQPESMPAERRKFTIAELRRIGAFPDDFVLTGSYAQQWERIGNSVPPLMMRAIAAAVRDGVLLPARAAAAPARSSTATPRASGRARAASPPASAATGASRAPRSRRRQPAEPTGAT